MPYPSLEDVIALTSVGELIALDGTPEGEVLLLAAIQGVEEFTGQSFDTVDSTYVLRGTGGTMIYLPRRLEEVTEVVGGGITIEDVLLSDAHDALAIRDWRGTSGAYERVMRDISGESNPRFPDGSISVTGTWGWSVCPEAVVAAIRCDMEDTARADANDLSPTVAAARALGLKDISQGNLRVNIGVPSVFSPRATRFLRGLVWHGSGGQMI